MLRKAGASAAPTPDHCSHISALRRKVGEQSSRLSRQYAVAPVLSLFATVHKPQFVEDFADASGGDRHEVFAVVGERSRHA